MARKKAGDKQVTDGENNAPNAQADHDSVAIGGISIGRDLRGEVNIAAGDIIKNVNTIHQRALTAAEEAARARKLESKLLAQGIATLVQNLSAQASEGTESDSPYKGLLPYGLNEAEIFHGRDKAKKDLLAHIKQNPLTVLHAESGAGKSSLLQAGIAARLIANGHLAVYLRPRDSDPVDFIKRMFLPELTQAPALAKASLREFLRQVNAVLGSKTTLYLLLDQFEEFFHLLDKNERQPLLESLADCLSDPSLKVRWVLALRAEALSKLAELETVGIAPFKNMYSLHRLSRAEAQEAIIEPARRHGIVFEPALIDHILDTLTTSGEVTPTHLQLVCSALTDDLPSDQTLTLTYYIDHEGDTEGILRDYLKRQLDHLPIEEQAPAWKVLRALITADRLRDLKTYDQLVEELKLSGVSKEQIDLVLARLVERRLLATQPATMEAFELAHDYLVKEIELDPQEQARKAAQELLIQETRSYQRHKTLLTVERLAVIKPYQNELSISPDAQALLNESQKAVQAEQRARERRRNINLGVSIAAAIVMSLLALWGWRSSEEAIKQAATANAASTEALAQQAAAQTASTNAVAQAEEAKKQSNTALARQLAAQAQPLVTVINSKQVTAVLLAIQSMRLSPSVEAFQVLDRNLLAYHVAYMTNYGSAMNSVAFSADGRYVVAGVDDNYALIWEVDTGELVAQMYHDMGVAAVALSPDGRYVVSATWDQTLRVWESATTKEVARMTHDEDGVVRTVAFSPDGKYVVSKGDKSARVWDAATGKEVAHVTHGHQVNFAAFSPDGRYVVSAGCDELSSDGDTCLKGSVRVLEVITGKEVHHLIQDASISSVAFSTDGNYAASGSSDGVSRVWQLATGREIFRTTTYRSAVSAIAFSPDDQYVVAGSFDGTVRVWEAGTGKEVQVTRPPHGGPVLAVAFGPDSKYVVSGSSSSGLHVWDVTTGKEISILAYETLNGDGNPWINSIVFSSDRKYMAVGGCDHAAGVSCVIGGMHVWEIRSNKTITRMTHDLRVMSVAFSPDGRYVLSAGCEELRDVYLFTCSKGSTRVWDVTTGKEVIRTSDDPGVWSAAFSPDGKYIVSTGCDRFQESWCDRGRITVWETSSGHEIARMVHDGPVNSVAFSPDSKYIVSAWTEKTARVWEASTGKEIARLTHEGIVIAVAFSPDGKYVASGDDKGTAVVWDTTDGKEVSRMDNSSINITMVHSIAFSPDSKYVVSGSSDGTVRLWEAATGNEIWSINYRDVERNLNPDISALRFSPNGKYVVSGGCEQEFIERGCSKGSARVWDAETGREISRMVHEGSVDSVTFSPDGNYVLSMDQDTTTRVWEAATGQEVARMIHATGVTSVAFSPNGKYIVSGSVEGEVTIREYRAGDLIADACSRVTRNLTGAEWKQYVGNALPYQAICPDLPIEPEQTYTP